MGTQKCSRPAISDTNKWNYVKKKSNRKLSKHLLLVTSLTFFGLWKNVLTLIQSYFKSIRSGFTYVVMKSVLALNPVLGGYSILPQPLILHIPLFINLSPKDSVFFNTFRKKERFQNPTEPNLKIQILKNTVFIDTMPTARWWGLHFMNQDIQRRGWRCQNRQEERNELIAVQKPLSLEHLE